KDAPFYLTRTRGVLEAPPLTRGAEAFFDAVALDPTAPADQYSSRRYMERRFLKVEIGHSSLSLERKEGKFLRRSPLCFTLSSPCGHGTWRRVRLPGGSGPGADS